MGPLEREKGLKVVSGEWGGGLFDRRSGSSRNITYL